MSTAIKYELECAKTWEDAKKLAADGWELVAVNQANGDDWVRFFFQREVKK